MRRHGSVLALFFSLPGITRESLNSGDSKSKKMQGINKINRQPLQLLNYDPYFQSSEITIGMDTMIQTFLAQNVIKQRKL